MSKYREHLEELLEQRTYDLNKANEKITAMLKSVPDRLIVTDLNRQIILMNRRAEAPMEKTFSEIPQLPAEKAIAETAFRDLLPAAQKL